MVYDENIAKDEERINFRKELDLYLNQRKQIVKKKKHKKPGSEQVNNITLEIYSENEPEKENKRSFFAKILSWFVKRKGEALSEELIEEEVVEEEPLEIRDESSNNEFEEMEKERISSGFFSKLFAKIKKIFVKEEICEDVNEETIEEDQQINTEELERDLKVTFRFVKAILTNIPSRYLNRIKELKEFNEYRDVIKRFNERHKKQNR